MAKLTKDNLPEFRKKYRQAVDHDHKYFMFNGQQVLVQYAKYLLEYVDLNINKDKKVLPRPIPGY